MLACMQRTDHYEHDYFFKFKGEKYRVHSVVRLTEEGRLYLGAARREVILTEQFTNWNKSTCWKYEFKSIKYNVGIINKCTDRTPDDLIAEIIMPASADYAAREILGPSSFTYKVNATKHTKKDWEIPELKKAWFVFILVFIGTSVFADWYIQLILRFVAGAYFYNYRKNVLDACTAYIHDEDNEIIKKKYEALYGIKPNKEDK